MPVKEHLIQSHSTLPQYTLRSGQEVYVSNGCTIERWTQRTLAGSEQSADYLLANAVLTKEQREWLEDHGRYVFPNAGFTPMSHGQLMKQKYG